ncbi:unnamed protein product (macronuclear) [Paramecium tetraurelia]|uniref:Transmembrane protein n=1 Tax=Paramecium tetraurelia TaxID=5888 RepID=A0EDU9_PARTE|nr:uncharacterized protein GSPATT00025810001 [Paramecium tetraurelia]CAK93466.1 unnamed protein product [Paramecium tetraurelia]|eukprot:XP_001460863.1 hypothetical protein (macronuclear) [Paramecium tetraurelia strain d4-2]
MFIIIQFYIHFILNTYRKGIQIFILAFLKTQKQFIYQILFIIISRKIQKTLSPKYQLFQNKCQSWLRSIGIQIFKIYKFDPFEQYNFQIKRQNLILVNYYLQALSAQQVKGNQFINQPNIFIVNYKIIFINISILSQTLQLLLFYVSTKYFIVSTPIFNLKLMISQLFNCFHASLLFLQIFYSFYLQYLIFRIANQCQDSLLYLENLNNLDYLPIIFSSSSSLKNQHQHESLNHSIFFQFFLLKLIFILHQPLHSFALIINSSCYSFACSFKFLPDNEVYFQSLGQYLTEFIFSFISDSNANSGSLFSAISSSFYSFYFQFGCSIWPLDLIIQSIFLLHLNGPYFNSLLYLIYQSLKISNLFFNFLQLLPSF